MKQLVVAFTGVSNSGKTTLIEKISKILSKNFKVCIIKHDPKDKAKFDTEGKDSYRFYQSGASVAVVSPTRSSIFLQESLSIKELADKFGEFDYLFVEGLKYFDIPRISIFRDEIFSDYFDYSNAYAVDESIDISALPKDKEILDLNNPTKIIEWIDKSAKPLKEIT